MSVEAEPTITLTRNDDGWWTARNHEVGVSSQGATRDDALDNLDEAVALHRGEIGEQVEDQDEALRRLGIDPDGVDGDRERPDVLE